MSLGITKLERLMALTNLPGYFEGKVSYIQATKLALELAEAAYNAGYEQARGTLVCTNKNDNYPSLPKMALMTKAPNFPEWIKQVEEAINV